MEPGITGQRLPGPFAHFRLSGPHAAARDLVPSLVSVLLKPPVGSVPRALSSFQAGLLLWKFRLPWDRSMCLLFLGRNMVAPGHPKGSASGGSPVCQLPSVCLRQRTFWESLRSPQDAESPDDTLSAVYSAPDCRGSAVALPWDHLWSGSLS